MALQAWQHDPASVMLFKKEAMRHHCGSELLQGFIVSK